MWREDHFTPQKLPVFRYCGRVATTLPWHHENVHRRPQVRAPSEPRNRTHHPGLFRYHHAVLRGAHGRHVHCTLIISTGRCSRSARMEHTCCTSEALAAGRGFRLFEGSLPKGKAPALPGLSLKEVRLSSTPTCAPSSHAWPGGSLAWCSRTRCRTTRIAQRSCHRGRQWWRCCRTRCSRYPR